MLGTDPTAGSVPPAGSVPNHPAVDNRNVRTRVTRYVLAAALLAVAGRAGAARPEVNPKAAALKEFSDRMQAYMALHAKVAGELPPRPHDAAPEAIAAHRERLAAGIRNARHDAREGDVFTPAVTPQFRLLIRRDLQSRDMRDAAAAMEDVPYALAVRVNAAWPSELPRSTIPPRLLTSLYPLPEGLEYRFFDRHLVLLDVDAQLIVDIARDVIPSSVRRRR